MTEQTLPHNSDTESSDDIITDDVAGIEAYCVRCRKQVEVLEPEPVWTSRGQPGTRGTCPECGTTVFRLGRTAAHDRLQAPPPVRVEDVPKIVANRGRKRALPATYINTENADVDFGGRLAKELDSAGVHTWFDAEHATDKVAWAGGVHPALRDCVQMVVIWSQAAAQSGAVKEAWTFFKNARKPIALVLLDATPIPDELRRSPRFDFSKNYKGPFRQLLETLGDWQR